MVTSPNPQWPALTRYAGRQLRRVALPLGGIGTGTISLGGRGDLHDWEVGNRPAKGFTPRDAFFVLRTQRGDAPPVLRGYLGTGNTAAVMAGVTMAIAPVLAVFLLFQRYLIEGITLTGLKE